MVNAPNVLTIARILGIPIFLVLLASSLPRWIPTLVFCILAATDLVDGRLARRKGKVTRSGAVLDPLADKLLVSAALVFLIGKGVDAWMAYVIVAREFMVTALRLIAPSIIHAKKLGKWKTFVQNCAIVAVLLSAAYAWWFMLAATVLTIVSGLEYVWIARKQLKF